MPISQVLKVVSFNSIENDVSVILIYAFVI